MKTKALLLVSALVMSSVGFATEQIIPTDASGNRQWHKTQYRIEGNKIIPTDASGNRQWQQTHDSIVGNDTLPTDASGNRLWNQTNYRSE